MAHSLFTGLERWAPLILTIDRSWLVFVFGLNSWYLQRELNLVVDVYQGAAPGTQVSLAS